jgi:hypothetical protein
MCFSKWINSKLKKMSYVDMAFVKASSVTFGVLLAALFPAIAGIDPWWIAAIVALLAVKPMYTALKK